MSNSDQSFPVNETLLSIRNRRSVRTFSDTPVDEEHLNVILRSANQAPSAHNQQSWRFVVLKGEKKAGLADLVAAKSDGFPRTASALLRMAARSIVSAPVVIAVANTGELIARGTELFQVDKEAGLDFFRIMEIQSSAAAVQNLLIAATSLGLGTVWLGVLVLVKHEVLEYIGEPDGEFMAVIPVGYAAKTGQSPKKQPLDIVVRYL